MHDVLRLSLGWSGNGFSKNSLLILKYLIDQESPWMVVTWIIQFAEWSSLDMDYYLMFVGRLHTGTEQVLVDIERQYISGNNNIRLALRV